MANSPEGGTQPGRARYLFSVAILGVVLYGVLDAVAQSLPPHYSPLSQAESDLAVGQYGYVMALNFINRGVLSLCFLYGIMLSARSTGAPDPRLRRGVYAFSVWAVGALLLAAFPTDVPATPVSWHGAIHLMVAVFAFLGGAIGALYISFGMARNSPFLKAKGVALPIAVVVVVLCVVELIGGGAAPGLFARYGGLVERLFLGSVLLWVFCVSALMLTRGQPQRANSAVPGA